MLGAVAPVFPTTRGTTSGPVSCHGILGSEPWRLALPGPRADGPRANGGPDIAMARVAAVAHHGTAEHAATHARATHGADYGATGCHGMETEVHNSGRNLGEK